MLRPHRVGHYEMTTVVCLSVCLSVAKSIMEYGVAS